MSICKRTRFFLGRLSGNKYFNWVKGGQIFFIGPKGRPEHFSLINYNELSLISMERVFDTERGDQNFFPFCQRGHQSFFSHLQGGQYFLPQPKGGPEKILTHQGHIELITHISFFTSDVKNSAFWVTFKNFMNPTSDLEILVWDDVRYDPGDCYSNVTGMLYIVIFLLTFNTK